MGDGLVRARQLDARRPRGLRLCLLAPFLDALGPATGIHFLLRPRHQHIEQVVLLDLVQPSVYAEIPGERDR